MQRTHRRRFAGASIAAAALFGSVGAHADYTLRCKSNDREYNTCRLSQPGYVTVERQISNARCEKGRSWDYDRREIWVDRGCEAEFRVETQDDHKSARTAAGVLVGAAIVGALLENKARNDDAKYRDDNYYGSRHTSYVPGWMVGTFAGYNPTYGANVSMTISSDGRVLANADGQSISGYINDGHLHVGNVVFDVDQTREGFVTSQKGDRGNEVRYRRIN